MITISDIANRVGVSRPTVSMVLNNTDSRVRISERTRQRVLEAVREMGYCRNEVAASFRKGRTQVIGVVGRLQNSFILPILSGIAQVLEQQQFSIKVYAQSESQEDMDKLSRACVGSRLAGVIAVDMGSLQQVTALREGLAKGGIPLMLADSVDMPSGCFNVMADDASGIAQAVAHLRRQGHQRIAHVTVDAPFAGCRRQAFLDTARGLDLPVGEADVHCVNTAMTVTPGDVSLLEHVLDHYTAAVCQSDYLAMKILRVAAGMKRSIPDDFSVIGFADLECSALCTPALTTVAQPFHEIGRSAAQAMLDHIQGRTVEPGTLRLPVTFVERSSTAAPARP